MSIKLGRPRFGLWEEASNPIDQSVPTFHDILVNRGRTNIYIAQVRAIFRANPSSSVNGTIMITDTNHSNIAGEITTAFLSYGVPTDAFSVTAEWSSPIAGLGLVLPPNSMLCINFDAAGVIALCCSDVTYAT